MARPTILNDHFIEEFCLNLRLSDSIETAILKTGCGRQSFYRWKRHVTEGAGTKLERRLMKAIDKSQAETKMRVEFKFSKLCDKSWRAMAWWLERKYPQEYGQKRRLPPRNPDSLSEPDQPDAFDAPVKLKVMRAKPAHASAGGVFEASEAVSYTWVPGTYYQSLALAPLLGRLLTTGDDSLDAPPVAVLTEAYWARRFERNPNILGAAAQIEGFTVTVVGVSPNLTDTSSAPGADLTMTNGVRPRVPPGREARTISWGEVQPASVTREFQEPSAAKGVHLAPLISIVV